MAPTLPVHSWPQPLTDWRVMQAFRRAGCPPVCATNPRCRPLLVRLTGFSPRSGTKWSQGETPSAKQEKALVEMDRLLDGLSRVMEPVQVGRWLMQPNTAFDGSTPLQVVERGEMDRIWRMLYDLESGQPG